MTEPFRITLYLQLGIGNQPGESQSSGVIFQVKWPHFLIESSHPVRSLPTSDERGNRTTREIKVLAIWEKCAGRRKVKVWKRPITTTSHAPPSSHPANSASVRRSPGSRMSISETRTSLGSDKCRSCNGIRRLTE